MTTQSPLTMDQKIQKLTEMLGRHPTVTQLRDGNYLADYMAAGAPALSLVGTTEQEALEKLYVYLSNKKTTLPK